MGKRNNYMFVFMTTSFNECLIPGGPKKWMVNWERKLAHLWCRCRSSIQRQIGDVVAGPGLDRIASL